MSIDNITEGLLQNEQLTEAIRSTVEQAINEGAYAERQRAKQALPGTKVLVELGQDSDGTKHQTFVEIIGQDKNYLLGKPVEVHSPLQPQETYHVIIYNCGNQRVNVIKALRTLTGFGLREAADVVNNYMGEYRLPIEYSTINEAKLVAAMLRSAGATVEAFSSDPQSNADATRWRELMAAVNHNSCINRVPCPVHQVLETALKLCIEPSEFAQMMDQAIAKRKLMLKTEG